MFVYKEHREMEQPYVKQDLWNEVRGFIWEHKIISINDLFDAQDLPKDCREYVYTHIGTVTECCSRERRWLEEQEQKAKRKKQNIKPSGAEA